MEYTSGMEAPKSKKPPNTLYTKDFFAHLDGLRVAGGCVGLDGFALVRVIGTLVGVLFP
jgi:hypothetical protein